MLTWIAGNTAIALLMALLALPVCALLRSRPALCHLLWLAVLCRLLAPPVPVEAGWRAPLDAWMARAAHAVVAVAEQVVPAEHDVAGRPLPDKQPREPAASDAAPASGLPATGAAGAGHGSRAARRLARASAVLPWLWLAGSLLALAGLVRGVRRFAATLLRAAPAPPELLGAVAYVSRTLGVAPPRVALLVGLPAPIVWGLGRPLLLWPADPAGHPLPSGCRTGLLAHELAHLRRRDHLVAWLEMAGAVLLWWNPVFWLARRRLRRHAEEAADAWAVWTLPNHRRDYAEALIDAAERGLPRATVPVLAVSDTEPRQFQRRLQLIMSRRVAPGTPRSVALAIVAATALLLPGAPRAGTGAGAGPPTQPWQDIDVALHAAVQRAALWHQGRTALAAGDGAAAVRLLGELSALAPDEGGVWAELGRAHAALGQDEQAVACHERQRALGHRVADALADLAAVELSRGRREQALARLQEAVANGFRGAEWLAAEPRMDALRGTPELGNVSASVERLLALTGSAWKAVDESRWDEALALWEQLAVLAPQDGLSIHMRAYTLFHLGRPNEALPLCERQLQLGFRPEVALYNIACGRALTGDADGALDSLHASVTRGFDQWDLLLHDSDLAPLAGHPRFESLRALAEERRDLAASAKAAVAGGDWTGAARAWQRLSRAEPANVDARLGHGDALLRLGRHDDALAVFAGVVTDTRAVREGLLRMSDVLARAGRHELALAYLDGALATGPVDRSRLAEGEGFAALAGHPRFAEILRRAEPPSTASGTST